MKYIDMKKIYDVDALKAKFGSKKSNAILEAWTNVKRHSSWTPEKGKLDPEALEMPEAFGMRPTRLVATAWGPFEETMNRTFVVRHSELSAMMEWAFERMLWNDPLGGKIENVQRLETCYRSPKDGGIVPYRIEIRAKSTSGRFYKVAVERDIAIGEAD